MSTSANETAGPARGPIGVFDSGVGGLTVARALVRAFPQADVIYLGDTARVPYGSKSPQVVTRYALNAARFLIDRGVTSLVVACHTASSVALETLEKTLPVPVVGMVETGALGVIAQVQRNFVPRAAADPVTMRALILGTRATIASGAYARRIAELWRGHNAAQRIAIETIARPCPLFVPLADEGLTGGPIAAGIAQHYLGEFSADPPHAALLGCTHYPLLREIIAKALGDATQLIDPADETAAWIGREWPAAVAGKAQREFYVTDLPDRFAEVAERFFGAPVGGIEQVDLAA